ncbi:MAG: hypothetical protein ABIK65_09955 [Candidatus Eisenbacteria bacterium]
MIRILFGALFVYLLARIVANLFRGFLPRREGIRPEAPGPTEVSPLSGEEIEDADWEEIEDSKGDSG